MNEQIQQWRSSLSSAHCSLASVKGDGLAARLTSTACDLYQSILKHLLSQLPKHTYRKIEQPLDYLLLWSDGYGALSGDLDAVLADWRRLRHATISHLTSICRILSKKLVSLIHGQTEKRIKELAAEASDLCEVAAYAIRDQGSGDLDSSDDESDVSSDHCDGQLEDVAGQLEDVAEDLKTEIQCLQALGPGYEEPVRDKVAKEKVALASHGTTWDPAEYLASRIRHRYPGGDAQLITLLGKTNWQRLLRLHAAKEKIRLEPEVESAGEQKAATLGSSNFHDSGLGSSTSPESSYADTLVSYRDAKGGSIKIPPLPAEAVGGEPFACTTCGRKIRTPTTSLWKKHLLLDLQPYVCFVRACRFNSSPFAEKKIWVRHLELDHGFVDNWQDMVCPLCGKPTGSGKQAVVSHLSRHLEETSLTILPTNADSDDEKSDDVSDQESWAGSIAKNEENERRNIELPSAEELEPLVAHNSPPSYLIKNTSANSPIPALHDTEALADRKSQGDLILGDVKNTNQRLTTAAKDLASTDELHLHGGSAANGPLFELARVSQDDEVKALTTRPSVELDEGWACQSSEYEKVIVLMDFDSGEPARISIKESAPVKCRHSGCVREFERPCDLSKHEKRHSRPWKCLEATCDFSQTGFHTKKDLYRHLACHHPDSDSPALFKCRFEPCPFKSKREDNRKRHMRLVHGGWYGQEWPRGKSEGQKYGIPEKLETGRAVGANDCHAPDTSPQPDESASYPNLDFPTSDAPTSDTAHLSQFGIVPQEIQLDYAPMDNAIGDTPGVNSVHEILGADFRLYEDIYGANVQLPTPVQNVEAVASARPWELLEPLPLAEPVGLGNAMLYTPASVAEVDEGGDFVLFRAAVSAKPSTDQGFRDGVLRATNPHAEGDSQSTPTGDLKGAEDNEPSLH